MTTEFFKLRPTLEKLTRRNQEKMPSEKLNITSSEYNSDCKPKDDCNPDDDCGPNIDCRPDRESIDPKDESPTNRI